MKWLPRLALAARRELTSCNLAQAPLRTQAPFVKDAWRSQTLTYHVYAAGVWGWGWGGLELITAGTQLTDQYQPIRKLPAVESSLGMPEDLCP